MDGDGHLWELLPQVLLQVIREVVGLLDGEGAVDGEVELGEDLLPAAAGLYVVEVYVPGAVALEHGGTAV